MNTEIKGHLQVTRSMTVASRLTALQDTNIEGNLKVKGWLDAKNIKAPCKGLFASAEELADRYPEPRPGWWALVGDAIPAEVYRSNGDRWISTGAMGGETVVDLNHYDKAIEAVDHRIDDIDEAIEAVDDRIDDIEETLDRIDSDITDINTELDSVSAKVDNIDHPVDMAESTTAADLEISDDDGNVLARFANGHIRTRYFNSANIKATADGAAGVSVVNHSNGTTGADLDIADPQGRVLMRIADGHIQTKHFNSANISQYITDRATGRRYMIAVENGVLQCVPEPVNILILGNSFTRHPALPSVNWYDSRGMASTVKDNDYASLLAEGTGGHVEIATIGSSENCVQFEQGYSPTFNLASILFDRTIDYGIIIVELNENAGYNASMQASWEHLYRWLKMLYPSATVIQLIGWDVPLKTAAIQAACNTYGVTLMNNDSLTYTAPLVAGQYVARNDRSALYPVSSAIITHPSDVGMLLIANRILQYCGYRPLNKLHEIRYSESAAAVVTTINGYNRAVARGVVTLRTSGDQVTVRVTDNLGINIPVTMEAANTYCFYMPDSDVVVSI